MGVASLPLRVFASAFLLLWLTPATAQLVEAECWEWPPGLPFPDSLYMERARNFGVDVVWREFAAKGAIRAGQPPSPPTASSAPAWTWHADHSAIARTSDLGVFVSRFNANPLSWEQGVSDGYVVSAWAYVSKGSPKVIATTWLHVKNDRPLHPHCKNRLIVVPGNGWYIPRRDPFSDVAAAATPPAALRDADNSLIAATTCRDRWPKVIAAAGEDKGTFLLPGVGEVLGGARLRSAVKLLPDEPVRWRRLKFLSSRDEKLGLSIGRLVNCDDPKVEETYISAWVREGESWRLELLAIAR